LPTGGFSAERKVEQVWALKKIRRWRNRIIKRGTGEERTVMKKKRRFIS
jgi:hypothetical protein